MQKNYSPFEENDALQYITPEIPPRKRVIVAAAIYFHKEDVVIVSARHFSPITRNLIKALKLSYKAEHTQGFIDQWDQFLGREDAKRIAIANGQNLIELDYRGPELFSENLY